MHYNHREETYWDLKYITVLSLIAESYIQYYTVPLFVFNWSLEDNHPIWRSKVC